MSSVPLFEHRPSAAPDCRVEVLPDRRGEAVTPRLYGKFCEHLGTNIYQGMDAQVLRNPTFGAWPFGGAGTPPDGGLAIVRDAAHARSFLEHQRDPWPHAEALCEAYADGGAFGWRRVGSRDAVRLSPDVAANGDRAQRVEVTGDAAAGLAQDTYLPLHRTRGYEYRVLARAAEPVEVTVALGRDAPADGPGERLAAEAIPLGRQWAVRTGRLELPPDADPDGVCTLSLLAPPGANLVVARVLLRPDDHLGGADPDVVRLLREARLPLLRWPGGNFVSGYHWRDGVGPADQRPTRDNPSWACLEPNLFGTDEFVAFCRAAGCEPMICVNAGSSTPDEAAAWVEYSNGGPDTPMGRLRAAGGHPEPYGVRLWEVGNELYGRWQVHWTTPGGYADRYRRFAEAMRAADPSIELLACGHWPGAAWDEALIRSAGADLRCITHHPLMGGTVDESVSPEDLYHAFLAYPDELVRQYARNRDAMAAAGIPEPRVAVTELQLFAHFQGKAEDSGSPAAGRIPTPATVAEALYDAVMIHAFARAGRWIEMLTHSATVNHGGGLRKARERVWATPAHHGHVMGAAFAGGVPLGVRVACPTVATAGPTGNLPAVEAMPVLDAFAAETEAGERLVMLVHRSAGHGPLKVALDLGGPAGGEAEVVTLAGEALNDANTRERPERIAPRRRCVPLHGSRLSLEVPPFSLTRIRVPRAR